MKRYLKKVTKLDQNKVAVQSSPSEQEHQSQQQQTTSGYASSNLDKSDNPMSSQKRSDATTDESQVKKTTSVTTTTSSNLFASSSPHHQSSSHSTTTATTSSSSSSHPISQFLTSFTCSTLSTTQSSSSPSKRAKSCDTSKSKSPNRPNSPIDQYTCRSSQTAKSPTSTCPSIASALWRPLWPPGWHPRTNSSPSCSSKSGSPSPAVLHGTPSPIQRTDSADRSSTNKGTVPPVITMSRPVEEDEEEPSSHILESARPASLKSLEIKKTGKDTWSEEDRAKTPVDEYEMMESWLDEHPAFLHSYFVRKASRSIVDAWLQARTCHSSSGLSNVMPSMMSGQCASAPVSGSTTPVRKISAHEFEKCSLFLRPMVSTTSDGTPTFLPVTPSEAGGMGSSSDVVSRPPRKSRQELEALDEKQLIFELVKDICNDLDVKSLCHKILQNVSTLTMADRCSLFLVRGDKEDGDKRTIVSTLFDVSPDSTIEQMERKEEIIVPWNTGIVGFVAASGEAVHISDCYHDKRFSDIVDKKTGYKTRNMMCAPIHDIFGEVMGVAQVINKKRTITKSSNNNNSMRDSTLISCAEKTTTTLKTTKNPSSADNSSSASSSQSHLPSTASQSTIIDLDFDDKDMQVFTQYLQFCGIGLRNAQLFERSQMENKRNQVLLDLARMVFEEQSTIEHIVYRIMLHIQSLLEVERCQILLIAEESEYESEARKTFCRVFDLESSDVNNEEDNNNRQENKDGKDDEHTENNGNGPHEGRFPINVGITGFVATTGQTLNIPDAYSDPRFDRHVDDNSLSGFIHKSILCMPIKNASGKIIGVSQLVNKLNGQPFSRNDENLFEAFSIFCGMGIQNVQMYEKVVKSMAKQKVTFEILSYHATVSKDESVSLSRAIIPSSQALRLTDLSFSDFCLDEDNMVKATLRMFIDLDLIERFHMDYGILCRWLLSVRKNYRPVTYHNWRHAFNVAQMMFSILTNTGLHHQVLGEIETLALLVACLCHDLDHRGTNNSFQVKSSSPLAQLYSTSVMERHHFDQCLMILNSEGNQILSSLSPEEYRSVIHVLEEAILATDIQVYFKNRQVFFKYIESHSDPVTDLHDLFVENSSGRRLLRGMLMTACDIAAITKPWSVQRVVAQLVATEFFQQGDIEKKQLNLEPEEMMNREKEDQLPKMQVNFIDTVCLPVYDAFATLFPDRLSCLRTGVLRNREQWLMIAQEKEEMKEWAVKELEKQINQEKIRQQQLSNQGRSTSCFRGSSPSIKSDEESSGHL